MSASTVFFLEPGKLKTAVQSKIDLKYDFSINFETSQDVLRRKKWRDIQKFISKRPNIHSLKKN
jgi:hypothetical protein